MPVEELRRQIEEEERRLAVNDTDVEEWTEADSSYPLSPLSS